MKGNDHRGAVLSFGSFGLKTLDEAWLTDKQLEAARVALTRHMNVKARFGSGYFLISH